MYILTNRPASAICTVYTLGDSDDRTIRRPRRSSRRAPCRHALDRPPPAARRTRAPGGRRRHLCLAAHLVERGLGWAAFAAAFLLPDLAMLGYLKSARVGALTYNLAHTEWLPAAVLGLGLWSQQAPLVSAATIWLAHIGFDRALGYGLKYPDAFGHTHLGRLGRPPAASP